VVLSTTGEKRDRWHTRPTVRCDRRGGATTAHFPSAAPSKGRYPDTVAWPLHSGTHPKNEEKRRGSLRHKEVSTNVQVVLPVAPPCGRHRDSGRTSQLTRVSSHSQNWKKKEESTGATYVSHGCVCRAVEVAAARDIKSPSLGARPFPIVGAIRYSIRIRLAQAVPPHKGLHGKSRRRVPQLAES